MLESMLHSSRPTRAEATDIANAVLDGTDAIMLSGETAVGEYPIEAVKIMSKIAKQAEIIFDYQDYPQKLMANAADPISSTEAVALAAVQLATSIKAKAIITTTTSGFTARMVSRFRPSTPIFCASWDSKTQAQMAVIWGVNTIHIPVPTNTDEVVSHAIRSFVEQGYLKPGDTVVATAGVPAGTPGNTNLILVQVVKR
jgi:pyruvate kinase